MTPQPVTLRARDGRALAGHWCVVADGTTRRGVVVLNGATGFPQTFYFKFAQYLATRGYDVLVYDYRGMGASAPADLAREPARMRDWGLLDMPAALDAAAERAQQLPLFTLGHSVGGQFLGLLRNHARARAHVQVATSVGWWRWQRLPFRYLAWWFWRAHGPLMLALKGYIPSGGGWAGLPLPRGVYEEWRRWCLHPRHFGPDLEGTLAGHVFDEIRAPLLSVGLTDDPIATPRAVGELDRFFPHAARESRWYAPRDVGSRHIGHAGFFHSRHREGLWSPTADWLDRQGGVAA